MDDPNEPSDTGSSGVMVAACLLFIAILLAMLAGCATPVNVEQVRRIPPTAAMVKMEPLPAQTDPTMGGIYTGYVNAAQQYRACTRNLDELQEWVRIGQ